MTTAAEIAEILEHAANLIDERGHCTDGLYRDDRGRLCAVGAITTAIYGELRDEKEFDDICKLNSDAEQALRRSTPTPMITSWNDDSDKNTVTSTMRMVAATLRASETVTNGRSVETQTVNESVETIS